MFHNISLEQEVSRKGLILIFHTIVCKILEARNGVIFSSKEPVVEEIVEAIILVSCKCFLAKKGGLCNLYEVVKLSRLFNSLGSFILLFCVAQARSIQHV